MYSWIWKGDAWRECGGEIYLMFITYCVSKKISHFGLAYLNYEVIIYKIVDSFTYCRSNIDTLDLIFEVMIIDNFTLYFFFFFENQLYITLEKESGKENLIIVATFLLWYPFYGGSSLFAIIVSLILIKLIIQDPQEVHNKSI